MTNGLKGRSNGQSHRCNRQWGLLCLAGARRGRNQTREGGWIAQQRRSVAHACSSYKVPLRKGQQTAKLTQPHVERRDAKDLSLDSVNEEQEFLVARGIVFVPLPRVGRHRRPH